MLSEFYFQLVAFDQLLLCLVVSLVNQPNVFFVCHAIFHVFVHLVGQQTSNSSNLIMVPNSIGWLLINVQYWKKKNGWAHSIKAQHWMPLLQNIVKNLERQEVRDWLQNTREILEGEKKVAIYIFLCLVFNAAFHFKSIKLLSSSVDWLFEQSKAPW